MSNPYAEIGPCEYWPHGEREEQPGRDDRRGEAEPYDFFVVNKAGTGARVGCVRTGELLIVAHLVLPAHVPGRDLPGSRLAGAWLF
jgi:hypothetical protein